MKSGCGTVGFLVVFGLFWTGVVGTFDIMLMVGAVRQEQAREWPTTEATILHSEVVEKSDGDGTTYAPQVEYQYTVDGQLYTSDRYRFGAFTSTSDRDYAEGIVNRYPTGSRTTAHYDLADPSRAVLQAGVSGADFFMLLFMTPFNVIMLGLWGLGAGRLDYAIRKPPAGGVPIRRFGQMVHARLPRISPLAAAGLTALGISFASIFVVGFGFGFDPSMTVVGVVWSCVLIPAAIVYCIKKYRIGSGAKDLVIDHDTRTMSLPQTFGRDEDVIVPVAQVRCIEIERIVHRGKNKSENYSWAPTIVWTNDGGGVERDRVAEWYTQERALGFAEWLSAETHLPLDRSDIPEAPDPTTPEALGA